MAKTDRRPRFRVREMLVAVAIVALLGAAALNWLPSEWRRRRAEALLAEQYRSLVAPNAAPIQSFGRLGERRPADLADLRGSARAVARRLLRMVETPGDPGGGLPLEWRPSPHLPGVWAADRLGEWVVEVDDFELGREVTADLFDLAAGGRLLPEVESASLAVLLLELTPRLGLDDARKARAMARVRAVAAANGPKPDPLRLWTRLAAEVGNRDDLLTILDLAARDRELSRVVATSSALAECRWPGLVGPVARLADRSDDPRAFLEFAAFVATRAGREALFTYALDERHPLPERRGAIHRLKREPTGVAFLIEACNDPARRSTVVEFFGRDHARQPGDPPPMSPSRRYPTPASPPTRPTRAPSFAGSSPTSAGPTTPGRGSSGNSTGRRGAAKRSPRASRAGGRPQGPRPVLHAGGLAPRRRPRPRSAAGHPLRLEGMVHRPSNACPTLATASTPISAWRPCRRIAWKCSRGSLARQRAPTARRRSGCSWPGRSASGRSRA